MVVTWEALWETRSTDTVCAWAAERAVSSRWLTFALAVFSWEPEPTASHLRFPWLLAGGVVTGYTVSKCAHWEC